MKYERILIPVEAGRAMALQDEKSGRLYAVQHDIPTLPFDHTTAETLSMVVADLEKAQAIKFEHTEQEPEVGEVFNIDSGDEFITITNGDLAIRIPADSDLEQPFPGPIIWVKGKYGEWFAASKLLDAPYRGAVYSGIEAMGPCCLQWRTAYRWANDGGVIFRFRWSAGSDTILVEEEIFEDSDASVEWYPFTNCGAQAYHWGGGEGKTPMRPMTYRTTTTARKQQGRRMLGYMSHIGYWNQWNSSWVGFAADNQENFIGFFPAVGSQWERRGHLRAEIYHDDDRGDYLRFPLKKGRRLYGIVISTRAESGVEDTGGKCLLNRRKRMWSDLPPAKVLQWELNPPLDERTLHLIRQEDLDGIRDRINADAGLVKACETFLQEAQNNHPGQVAINLWKNDTEKIRAYADHILNRSEFMYDEVAEGGYERLIIFQGREIKRLAYDLDILWALDLIDEDMYRRIRSIFLLHAYMFADEDYCRYADFWPTTEPEEGIADALKDDMGDSPVPPNFCSEFYTTTALIAELFENHPMRDRWREFGIEKNKLFMEYHYAPDGSYHESLNYHTHEFNERLCMMYPLWFKGVHNFFEYPQIKGSFLNTVESQMPPMVDGIKKVDSPAPKGRYGEKIGGLIFGDYKSPRAVLPDDGNSGGESLQQEHRGEMTLGAYIYKDTDPELAGKLMNAWKKAGKIISLDTHPVLSVATLDPTIEAVDPGWNSVHRQGQFIVSKAAKADGTPIWCSFRAGSATHHMDFDQGNLHIAAWGSDLLGDYGYHAHDSEGNGLPAAATQLHNTIVYSDNRNKTSGYTGLERAPEPDKVHLGEDFDWVVHTIVNNNFRDFSQLPYHVLEMARTTVHVRHYLFVKPDYFLVWDVFGQAHAPSLFWLHPRQPMTQLSANTFRAGEIGKPNLFVQFIEPQQPEVFESKQHGPLWSFAIKNDAGKSYLTLLAPQKDDLKLQAAYDAENATVTVKGEGIDDTIQLPPAGSNTMLPKVTRQ